MAESKKNIPVGINCPHQLYWYNLRILVRQKSNKWHQLMVIGDFNSNYTELIEWMNDKCCVDILQKKQGACSITYQRFAPDPIDCSFGDSSINI